MMDMAEGRDSISTLKCLTRVDFRNPDQSNPTSDPTSDRGYWSYLRDLERIGLRGGAWFSRGLRLGPWTGVGWGEVAPSLGGVLTHCLPSQVPRRVYPPSASGGIFCKPAISRESHYHDTMSQCRDDKKTCFLPKLGRWVLSRPFFCWVVILRMSTMLRRIRCNAI